MGKPTRRLYTFFSSEFSEREGNTLVQYVACRLFFWRKLGNRAVQFDSDHSGGEDCSNWNAAFCCTLENGLKDESSGMLISEADGQLSRRSVGNGYQLEGRDIKGILGQCI